MWDERNREDSKLLANGSLGELFARYADPIRGRCIARIRNQDADDVFQNVMLRILREHENGNRWGGLPFRVVIHNAASWTINDYFQDRDITEPLPDGWESAQPDWTDEILEREYLMELLTQLTPAQREIAELWLFEGLGPQDIADRLGTKRNAIDQALFRIRRDLRGVLKAADA